MKAAVEVRGLHHRYGERDVLGDLGLTVEEGEFFVVIGPNGSGKTTLLKIMAGLLRPSGGEVRLLEKDLRRYSAKERASTVAFVPQSAVPDFALTVEEVILMGRAPYLGPLGIEGGSDLDIARRAMTFTGVAHLAGRTVDRLSGGELQRVFIARAICQEPKIMLLDEPTASLDLAHQVRIMDLMETLKNEKGITVVMVSHDVNLAAMYGDRLLLLKEGRKVSIGPPDKVLTYRTLEEAYGCTLLVDRSPIEGCPRVTLVPRRVIDALRSRTGGG
jgi:iron complex transport system ATP-binding protein